MRDVLGEFVFEGDLDHGGGDGVDGGAGGQRGEGVTPPCHGFVTEFFGRINLSPRIGIGIENR